jgi:hypothetical protein
MTTKLTLTIDDKVIGSAKRYARQRGKSLSGIIENYLKSIAEPEEATIDLSPKVTRLMGVINLPDNFDYKQSLGKALMKRHK